MLSNVELRYTDRKKDRQKWCNSDFIYVFWNCRRMFFFLGIFFSIRFECRIFSLWFTHTIRLRIRIHWIQSSYSCVIAVYVLLLYNARENAKWYEKYTHTRARYTDIQTYMYSVHIESGCLYKLAHDFSRQSRA